MKRFMNGISKVGRWLICIALVWLMNLSSQLYYPESMIAAGILSIVFIGFVVLCIIYKSSDTVQEEAQAAQQQQQQQRMEEERRAYAERRKAEEARKAAELAAQRAAIRAKKAADFAAALDALPSADIAVAEKPVPKRTVDEANAITPASVTKRSSVNKLGNYVVIDTETTGLRPASAEIVEIAAVRFREFEPVDKFTTLCSAKKGIDPNAQRINGIDADMVDGKPLFGQVVESLQAYIGDDNLVAHNLPFDLAFIVKHGFDVSVSNRKYYDTLSLAQHTLKKCRRKLDKAYDEYVTDYDSGDVENYKLGTLCSYYGIPFYEGHRALADAYVTGQLFYRLVADRTSDE